MTSEKCIFSIYYLPLEFPFSSSSSLNFFLFFSSSLFAFFSAFSSFSSNSSSFSNLAKSAWLTIVWFNSSSVCFAISDRLAPLRNIVSNCETGIFASAAILPTILELFLIVSQFIVSFEFFPIRFFLECLRWWWWWWWWWWCFFFLGDLVAVLFCVDSTVVIFFTTGNSSSVPEPDPSSSSPEYENNFIYILITVADTQTTIYRYQNVGTQFI